MKKGIFILLILTFVLSGCWDKRELNEIAITMAIGIEKLDDEYLVSAQVAIPSELSMQGGPGHSQITLLQAKGATVYDAIRKLTKESPRSIYPGHLNVLIISEELAKEGIGHTLDFFSRNYKTRSDFYVVIAKGSTAESILNIQTPIDGIPATQIFNTLKTAEKNYAGIIGITFADFVKDIEREGKEPVLPGISITGDIKSSSSKENVDSITPKAQLKYEGLSVFNNDKLIGWLDEKGTRSYSGIVNRITHSVGTFSCPEEGKADIEIINFESKLKGNVINGNPKISIDMQIEGNIGSIECPVDLTKKETIDSLEKMFEKEVKNSVDETIKKVQDEFSSDIFGFGTTIYQDKPKEWKKLKNHWDQEFTDLPVNVDVKVAIKSVGAINNSFLENLKRTK